MLCAASNRLMVGVDGKDILNAFKNGVVEYIESTYPNIVTEIDTGEEGIRRVEGRRSWRR